MAEEVTDRFLSLHPAWLTRYGDRARQFGIEDAIYHQDFLAGAIESGQVQAFVEYGEWAARMLNARRIEPRFLAESFQQIGEALRDRLQASDADVVDAFIRQGMERSLRAEIIADVAFAGPLEPLQHLYTAAAISGSREAALNLILEAVRQGRPILDIYTEVLQGAMYRIGALWEGNKITVAQEHTATAITQYVIARLYPQIDLPRSPHGKIIITGVQGEFHQVGGNMVADVLEASGWNVRFLGTNTPAGGVLDAIAEHEAGILGISATMLSNVPHISRLADAVRERFGGRIRIIAGGAAFRSAPLLYKEIGAAGCAFDLRSAIALAEETAAAPSA